MALLTKIGISVLALVAFGAAAVAMIHGKPEAVPAPVSTATSTPTAMMEASTTTRVDAEKATPAKSTTTQLALRTNAEWKGILTPQQYSVLREGGTEYPYTSDLLHETRTGTFVTADCGEPVFRSEKKFDSGTGWPSFYEPISGSVVIKEDTSLGMTREEVETPICHSHLGHLFHDAPQTPTGDRYCINGVALRFIPDPGQ